MRKPRAKPPFPPLRVVVRQEPPSPVQAAAFRALFDRLLAPCPAPENEKPPAAEAGDGDGAANQPEQEAHHEAG